MVVKGMGRMRMCLKDVPGGTKKQVEWVSREVDENGQPLKSRMPRMSFYNREIGKFVGFRVGNLRYHNPGELEYRCLDAQRSLYEDPYRNRVIVVKERFPCFDSYDLLLEDRYYRWYYFVNRARLFCVHYTDEKKVVEVMEDLDLVPSDVSEKMREAGWLEENW